MHFAQNLVAGGAFAVPTSLELGSLIPTGRAGLIAVLVLLAAVAILALLVAAAAFESDRRQAQREADDSELVTTTPLPMPPEELARMAAEPSPRDAFRPHGIPRWVQASTVLAALVITMVVAQRLRSVEIARRTDWSDGTDGVPSAGLTNAAIARSYGDGSEAEWTVPFAFRAREWVAILDGRGCTGRLEAASGAATAWELRARVHDTRGAVLDSARARVGSLSEGTIVEFAFPSTPCRRIDAWDVTGRRDPE